MKNRKFLVITIAVILFCNSCSKSTLQTKPESIPIESSPGMNGGIYTTREFSPVPNAEELKKNEYPQGLALAWLANHQEEDGHWDTGKYEGNGTTEINTATTGFALLAFLGAGHTVRAGKWKIQVKKALDWLVNSQKADGSFAKNNYVNGICTMAIADALAMGCGEKELRHAVELSVDYLLKQQNPSGGFYYNGPRGKEQPSFYDDLSVMTWCLMGLKSALLAGVKEVVIKNAFHKCNDLMNHADFTKDNTPTTKGESWYRANKVQGSGIAGGACQAMTIIVRIYMGWYRDAPWILAATQGQLTKIPSEYKGMDVYRVYFTVLAMFQQNRDVWNSWGKPVRQIIINAQRKDDDFKGSWDLTGCSIDAGGRILYTAMLCQYLEVWPRSRVFSQEDLDAMKKRAEEKKVIQKKEEIDEGVIKRQLLEPYD